MYTICVVSYKHIQTRPGTRGTQPIGPPAACVISVWSAIRKNRIVLNYRVHRQICCVHPLTLLDNTILVPHIGYVTKGQYQRRYRETIENVAAYLRDESSES